MAMGMRSRSTETGRTGSYDAHFFHRAKDGAISGQKFLSITVTGRDSLQVTWPDGSVEPGILALAEDGSPQTEIALDPGCFPFLEPGRTQLDCRLYPQDGALPSAAASQTDVPVALPGTDEAMGYLCTVGVEELERVTKASSDPYSTAVLRSRSAHWATSRVRSTVGTARRRGLRCWPTRPMPA